MVRFDIELGARNRYRFAPAILSRLTHPHSLAADAGYFIAVAQYFNRLREIFYRYALFDSIFDLFFHCSHLFSRAAIEDTHNAFASFLRGPRRIYRAVASADDHNIGAYRRGCTRTDSSIQGEEQRYGIDDAIEVFTRYVQISVIVRAYGKEEGAVSPFSKIGKGNVPADVNTGHDIHTQLFDRIYFAVAHLAGKPESGDTGGQHSSDNAVRFENCGMIAPARQLPGGGKTGRSAAHDGDLLSSRFGPGVALVSYPAGGVIRRETMQGLNEYGVVDLPAFAAAFTGVGAYAAEDSCQRRYFIDQAQGFVYFPFGNKRYVSLYVDAQRTCRPARRDPVFFDVKC